MADPILLTTLGGQPQVVTFALDALLAQGEPIGEVLVLHLSASAPRTRHSLSRLAREFSQDLYQGRPVRYRRVQITDGVNPVTDLATEAEVEATWQFIRALIAELKNEDRVLHLGISGGRRLLALLITSAAALLCDHRDRLWHLYTPDAVRAQAHEGALMHVEPSAGVRLNRVPLVPWGTYFPGLRAMAQTPERAVAEQMGRFTAGDQVNCRQVYEQLTPRQREALCVLATGCTPQEAAQRLHISLGTLNSHKTVILRECRTVWAVEEGRPLDYRFVQERFSHFCNTLLSG